MIVKKEATITVILQVTQTIMDHLTTTGAATVESQLVNGVE